MDQPITSTRFGHAVLQAKSFVENEDFFLFAGDTIIISDERNQHLERLIASFEISDADAAFLLLPVEDPKNYGIVFGAGCSQQDVVYVNKVIEKPSMTESNLAIMPIYVFKGSIFEYLKFLKPGKGNEIQLTDGIQMAISNGKTVVGTRIKDNELRLEIGNPETYFKAQYHSYNRGKKLYDDSQI